MHYKVVCSECGTIMAQCRCMKCDKEIRMDVCDICKQKMEMWNKN